MAKAKKVKYQHKQTIQRSSTTGRFVSSKFAKSHPKTTGKETVLIKHTA
jgi:hypothetical protein